MSNYKTRSVWENELIEWIGYDGLLRLEAAYGGTYRYIHAKEPDSGLIEKVGQEAAQALSDVYGPGDIYVPLIALKTKRNDEIVEGVNAGKTVQELAAKYKIKRRTLLKILRQRRNLV